MGTLHNPTAHGAPRSPNVSDVYYAMSAIVAEYEVSETVAMMMLREANLTSHEEYMRAIAEIRDEVMGLVGIAVEQGLFGIDSKLESLITNLNN